MKIVRTIFRIIGKIIGGGCLLTVIFIAILIAYGIHSFWWNTPYEDGSTINGVTTNGELLKKTKKETTAIYKEMIEDSKKIDTNKN
jgi:hypothetical protein